MGPPATALHRAERGTGEPLVLVHGSASDCRTWDRQMQTLSRRWRVIAYSRRYHWPNEPIAAGADYAMPEHVEDLCALLQQLDAEPAHLIGHSYGALLCLLVAMQRPTAVRTLVLSEPPALRLFVDLPPTPGQLLRLFATRPRTAAAILKFGATGFAPAAAAARRGDMEHAMRLFGRAVLGPRAFATLTPRRWEQVLANAIAAELLGSGFGPLDPEQVRRIRVPTLLVCGQRSPSLFRHLMDRLHELLPHAERATIAGASHIVHEDNAPDFDAAVLSFLDGSGGR